MGRDRRSSDVNGKRRSVSSDSIVEKRPHHERVPLQDLVGKSRELATAAVGALSWDLVVGMLPDYLKFRSKEEVIKLVSDELEGMSRSRIISILEDHEIPTSSSSESETDYSNSQQQDDVHPDTTRRNYERERHRSESSYSQSRSPSRSSRSPSASEEDDEISIYE